MFAQYKISSGDQKYTAVNLKAELASCATKVVFDNQGKKFNARRSLRKIRKIPQTKKVKWRV